jgi:hypothetical protein
METGNFEFEKNRNRGNRYARTKHVRVSRGQRKAALGKVRRDGTGKLATDILVPRKLRSKTTSSHYWRGKKDSVKSNLNGEIPAIALQNEAHYLENQRYESWLASHA